MADSTSEDMKILWKDLAEEVRSALTDKLSGLWGAASDEDAFNPLAVDKQQTLLILVSRLQAKGLWDLINKIDNVYGEGGVGIGFHAPPTAEATLRRRKDFTRFMANHKDTTDGFYEKGRGDAVLHFLYQEGTPRKWFVHFDLYSPVHSPISALRHLRYEFIGKVTPDWRMIQDHLNA
jgi:hypothetical protein